MSREAPSFVNAPSGLYSALLNRVDIALPLERSEGSWRYLDKLDNHLIRLPRALCGVSGLDFHQQAKPALNVVKG